MLKNATKNGEIFSYHFIINAPKFAPLLRSKRISSVEILRFSWSAEIAGKTQNLRTKNIRIWVDSTQDLKKLTQNAESIGVVEYKISFNPLIKSIAKYYVAILSLMAFAIFFSHTSQCKGQIRDFLATPNFKNIFIFGFLLYFIALFALLRGDVYYIDDWGRSLWGSDWNYFSRFMATFLAQTLGIGSILDISPIYQLIGIALMVLSSMMILYALDGAKKFSYFGMMALLPLGLSPYFLENMSYKFDALNMSFAVFCACLPFIFRKHTLPFCIIGVASLLLMLCSYQSANSVYILLALFIAFNGVVRGDMSVKEAVKFLLLSAVILITSAGIYKVFVVREVDDYVSSSMLPLKELHIGLIKNLSHYFRILHSDFIQGASIFFIFVCIVCVAFIIAILANKKSVWYFLATMLFLIVCLCLSYGLYLALAKPLFVPRAFNGIGAFVALLLLSAFILPKSTALKNLSKICIILLGYICIAFANAYGNALAKQQEWMAFRANLALNDLLKVGLDSNKAMVFIKGNIGYAPVAKRLVERHKVASRIIPILMTEGWGWNQSAFWHLKSPYKIEYDIKKCKNFSDKKSPKILLDNEYHTISNVDFCVFLTLKTGDK
ncbi:glucosyltransferase domain-containing protein [Helicobacter sp. 23-1045]